MKIFIGDDATSIYGGADISLDGMAGNGRSGEPLFSNWQGPGALNFSSVFGSIGMECGSSFTYRAVLLAVLMFPLLSLGCTLQFFEPIGACAASLLVSVVFYAVAGTTWKWIVEGPDGRGGSCGGN